MTDLPEWRQDAGGVWECDDPEERSFAIVAMFVYGFDVVAMDQWLGRLESCPARDEILEWRRQAKDVSLGSGPDAAMKPLLELMKIRRHTIDREGFLLPLAKTGDASLKRSKAGGEKTAATLKDEASARRARLKKAALDILKTDPRIKRRALAAMLADRGHGGAEAIRTMLPKLIGKKSSDRQ
jgi:hypothetical protein